MSYFACFSTIGTFIFCPFTHVLSTTLFGQKKVHQFKEMLPFFYKLKTLREYSPYYLHGHFVLKNGRIFMHKCFKTQLCFQIRWNSHN